MINSYSLAGYSYDNIWSTRKARSTYSGPCMRVRRSNDNLAQDIYFSGDDLDTASILSFVGSNTGYVDIWYDQSYKLVTKNMLKFSTTDVNIGAYRYWFGGGAASSTYNADVAPNNTNTAVRQNYTSTGETAVVYTVLLPVKKNTNYTFSVYGKQGTTSNIALRIYDGNHSVIIAEETKTLTSGWARYSITFNTGAYDYVQCAIRNGYSTTGYVYLWGTQLEQGSVMTDFEPTDYKALLGFDLYGGGGFPTICSGGTINTVNGKPAIYFNGTTNYMQYYQYFGIFSRSNFYLYPIDNDYSNPDASSWSTYVVTKPTRLSHTANQCIYGSDFNQGGGVRIGTFANINTVNGIFANVFANNATFLGSSNFTGPITGNNQIISSYRTRYIANTYVNGVVGTTLTGLTSNDQSGYYGVGCRIRNTGGYTEYYQGYIQEIGHYCGNLEANRAEYELAAKTYYAI